MKWKLGDFVRFVDERREGYVTRIFDEEMIGVTGDDDFEIPVPANRVTSVHGHEQARNPQSATTNEPAINAENFVKTGVYLAFITDNKAASVVHFHLVNTTSFQLLATFTTEQDRFKGEFGGIIAPGKSEKIYSAQLADIQTWPKFHIAVLFFTAQNIPALAPLHLIEKFKAKDFAGAKKPVPVINQNGWLIQLDEAEVKIDPDKLKESFFKTAEEKQQVERPQKEVDLHIEKLRDDYQFLSSPEILNVQLNHFRKALDAAIVHQLPEIVFIHGAGNGILKHELHKVLSKHQKVQTFMDARKEKFGYGATKVILK
jgi:hypothetical protein